MNNLNSVLIEGNLVRDPDSKVFDKEKTVATMAIATNRYYTDKEGEYIQEVSYFTITAWGNLAKTCVEYLHKGRGIRVVGRLRQERWKDNNNDMKERIGIVAEHIEFMPEKKENIEEKTSTEEVTTDEYEKSLKKILKKEALKGK